MGAKRKTDGERMAGHLDKIASKAARLRKTNTARLEALNVDLSMLQSDDPVQQRKLSKAVQQLEDTATLMRRQRLPSSTTEPTIERRAHATSEPRVIEINPAVSPAHRFEWPLEVIRDRLTSFQYEAAERLRNAHLQMQPRSAVADPTGAGGASDPSGKLAITEAQELAARDYHWIVGRLERSLRKVVENFILERVPEGQERCLTIVEYGNKVAKMAGPHAGKAAGLVAIMLTCDRLSYLWHAYDAWKREQCAKTDRMMRSEIGQRAGRQGWICALWTFCHRHKRYPLTQGEIDVIRANHDAEALRLRTAPPVELERWYRRRDRLTSLAFRDEDERVSIGAVA